MAFQGTLRWKQGRDPCVTWELLETLLREQSPWVTFTSEGWKRTNGQMIVLNTVGLNRRATLLWWAGSVGDKSLMPRLWTVVNRCPTPAVMVVTFTSKLRCQSSAGQLCVVPIDLTLHYVLLHASGKQNTHTHTHTEPMCFFLSIFLQWKRIKKRCTDSGWVTDGYFLLKCDFSRWS